MGKLGKWRICVQKLPPRHCTLFPLNALIDFRIWNLSRSRVWGRDWAPFLKSTNSIKLFEMDYVCLYISSKFIIWPQTSIIFWDSLLSTVLLYWLALHNSWPYIFVLSVSWSDELVQIKGCCTHIECLIR